MDQYGILIIDKDEDTLALFDNAPKAFPCLLMKARSSEEAFTIIKQYSVDVVICNLELAPFNGIEFLKEIKQIYPFILRILMSEAAEVNDLLDAVNAGEIYRYLIKPLKSEEVPLVLSESYRYCSKLNTKRKLMKMLSEQNLYLETLKNELESKIFMSGQALSSSQWILEKLPYYIVGWDQYFNKIYENKNRTLYFDLLTLLKSSQDPEGRIPPERSLVILGGWKIRFREYADPAIKYIAVLQKEDVFYE